MTQKQPILCIGAVLWDVIGHGLHRMTEGRDIPGRIAHHPGGVALNVAIALARHGLRPAVLGAVGCEPEGDALCRAAETLGVETGWLLRRADLPTDTYMAIEDPDGLIAAIADAHSLEEAGDAILAPLMDGRLASAADPWSGVAVLDGNLTTDLLTRISTLTELSRADLHVVPASPGKADRLLPLIRAGRGCFYLNRYEAQVLAGRPLADAAEAAQAVLALGAPRVIVTDGAEMVAEAATGRPLLREPPPQVTIARVTGAGDAFLAAHLAAETRGASPADALARATRAAADHVSGKDHP